ncbi:PTS sugar transporter subunit IIB [Lacticaseibacillus baoqingensis]|uniref:PTS sugar transporter subunit IIB n=1 Tax=Lacticaseibacillus baoqingensis TaxID=2486013 RepID=A0ABW4EC39_9LACO|nr:PTS sugar transporter subunit IIB [Lacticaseibacillus baoqingensis]
MSKKIYLFCSQGMSTSLLAQKMQDVADAHKMPVTVAAKPHGLLQNIVDEEHPDVIMLGPQVKYLYDETAEKYGQDGTPVILIDSQDYGTMNGERVLKQALLALKKKAQ